MASLQDVLQELSANIEKVKTITNQVSQYHGEINNDEKINNNIDFIEITVKANDALKCFCNDFGLAWKQQQMERRKADDDSSCKGTSTISTSNSSSNETDNNAIDNTCADSNEFWAGDDADDMSFLSFVQDEVEMAAGKDSTMNHTNDQGSFGLPDDDEEVPAEFFDNDEQLDSELGELDVLEVDSDDNGQPPSKRHLSVLKEYFGFSKFRPMQWQIISSILHQKRDNCVVMATGAGKSLCYQFPPVFTSGVSVVVSPLISLMEDQVQILNASKINACYLGSGQSVPSSSIKNDIFRGEYRLVYVTPEYLCAGNEFLQELCAKVTVTCIAIDEAHCVSQWGYDFRTSYQQLSFIKNTVPSVPVLALTATATPLVRKDICKNLKLKNPIIRCTSFDRENLFLEVRNKTSIQADMRSLMNRNSTTNRYSFVGPTIIYCPTRKKTIDVAETLTVLGVSCATYHAGMSMKDRKQNQLKFMSDELQCVVATVAFGMGIDKPDVRVVVHYSAPKDIESYYQEIGRAGRDGQPSFCCVFYDNRDFSLSRHFLSKITNQVFRNHKNQMLLKLETFITTSECRRKTILAHFEDKPSEVGGHKECCDNCLRKIRHADRFPNAHSSTTKSELDIGKDVQVLLEAIQETGDGRYGLTIPILLIRGSESQRLPPQYKSKSKLFGVGRNNTEIYWKAVGRELMSKGYLKEIPVSCGFGSTVATTESARGWLSNNTTSYIVTEPSKNLLQERENKLPPDQANPESSAQVLQRILRKVPEENAWKFPIAPYYNIMTKNEKVPQKVSQTQDKLQKELHEKVSAVRHLLSKKYGIPPVKICSNSMITDMVKIRPSCSEKVQLIMEQYEDNVVYPQRFAEQFVKEINTFCAATNASMDNFDVYSVNEDVVEDTEIIFLERMEKSNIGISITQYMSYHMHEEGLIIDEIVKKRSLMEDTIYGHLSGALLAGNKIRFDLLDITKDDVSYIVHVVRSSAIQSDVGRLRPIKEKLPLDIGYGKLKFVLAMLEITFGVEGETNSNGNNVQQRSTIPAFVKSTSTHNPQPVLDTQISNGDNGIRSVKTIGAKRKVPDWLSKNAPTSYKRKSNKKNFFSKYT